MLKEFLAKLQAEKIDCTELQGFIEKYQKMEKEIQDVEKKLTITENEKKQITSQIDNVKKLFNVDDLEKLPEAIKTQNTDTQSKELKSLEKLLQVKESELVKQKQEYESKIFDKDMDLELFKRSATLNTINDEANLIAISHLKKGASFENGVVVYKNDDGTLVRKNGLPLTIDDKIAELKSGSLSFLFKNDSKNGSGINITQGASNTSVNDTGLSDFSKQFLDKARSQNINILEN